MARKRFVSESEQGLKLRVLVVLWVAAQGKLMGLAFIGFRVVVWQFCDIASKSGFVWRSNKCTSWLTNPIFDYWGDGNPLAINLLIRIQRGVDIIL